MNENFDSNVNNEAKSTTTEPIRRQLKMPDPDFERSGTIAIFLGIAAIVVAVFYNGFLGLDLILAIISLIFAKKNKKASYNNRTNTEAMIGTICSVVTILYFFARLLFLLVWIGFIVVIVVFYILIAALPMLLI